MMKITRLYSLVSGLLLTCAAAGLCEETNHSIAFFGITVTDIEPRAETLFREGTACFYGDEVEQDLAKAVACFRAAAELGHAQAQFNLGLCCMNGSGVEQSDQEAAKWFTLSARQGIREALYPLGVCYYNLEQYAEAYAWALAAEAKGDTRLKDMLAPMYTEDEITAGKVRFEELLNELNQ